MAAALPPALRERLRPHRPGPLPAPLPGKDHVLYMLRTALRSAGNPALEVALRTAGALDLPLVCVAVVEDTFPAALARTGVRPTDRAAAFRLEALRELGPRLAARGSALFVHVERDGARQAVAMSLAARAAVVVCDEHFGVEPNAAAAARAAKTGVPTWLVDGACVVPATIVGRAALAGNAGFLRATAKARAARLAAPAVAAAPPAPRPPPPAPAWHVDLLPDGALEAALAAPSRRDATVARVRHTRGGSAAAEARWEAYVASGGLKTYAKSRNDPLAKGGRGASRMSAYVNLGMVDPTRIARDAAAAKADKFLSEFCGFRESSYLWCLLNPGAYLVAAQAVPAWGRGQLAATPPAPTVEALEAGRSGDALWDDCQRCLVLSGELHNNVRMAWGKAIPAWHGAVLAPSADTNAGARLQAALDLLVRLNDTYALDGGAPPSYGGLLWCLGWRDRPGSGGRPKPRPTSVMARRIKPGDLERLARARSEEKSSAATAAAAPRPAKRQRGMQEFLKG